MLTLRHDNDFFVKLLLQAAPLVALDLLGVVRDNLPSIFSGSSALQGIAGAVVIYLIAAISKKDPS